MTNRDKGDKEIRDDINPNKQDTNCQTPLICATWHGHEGVLELLVRREDINLNKPDNDGRTLL